MKIICVGRNYAEHAKELKNEVPEAPVLFLKPKTAILPQGKALYYPEFTKDLHYECELVVRICRNGRYIQEKFAHKYYEQVTLGIDFTARDLQQEQKKKGLPWEIAKAFDGAAAIGKFVSMPEGTDIGNIEFRLDKNGTEVQNGHTSDMIFTVDYLIAYISTFFSLNVGDCIFTGTPAGVGPVAINDRLSGYLFGEQVLDVPIL